MKASLLVAFIFAGFICQAQDSSCGLYPSDWCSPPKGDPCGKYQNANDCKADPKCFGMPYHGESIVTCQLDARGFGVNCPTVGCASVLPPPPKKTPRTH